MRLKQILLLAGVFLNMQVVAQHMWQLGNGTNVHWYYMDGDEFTGQVLDTSKWRNSYPWGRSLYCSNDPHYYTDGSNLFFNDGVVSLEARKENLTAKAVPYENEDADLLCNGKPMGKKNLMNFTYTAGMFFSNKQYKYGYFEIRFRADEGKGLWPAFWLYAGKDNYEIDIFEIVGSRNRDFHVDMHCPSGCKNYKTTLGLVKKNWGDYVGASENWKDGYNVIAAEWQPGYVKWYLNGQPAAYWKGNFENPMWVIADIAIAKDRGAFGPGPDASTKFPARFDIDYVRMWSTAPQQVPVTAFQGVSDPEARRTSAAASGQARVTKKTKPEYNRKALKSEQVFLSLAVSSGGKWMITVTGRPAADFMIKVTRKNGEVLYQSTDKNVQEHFFGALIAGEKHTLTLVNGGEQVMYDF